MGDGIKHLLPTANETTLVTQTMRRVEKLARTYRGEPAAEMPRAELKSTFLRLFGCVFMLYTHIFTKAVEGESLPLTPIEEVECNPQMGEIAEAMTAGVVCPQIIQLVNAHITESAFQIRREIAWMQHELDVVGQRFPIGSKAVPPKKPATDVAASKREPAEDAVVPARKKPRVSKPVSTEVTAEQ